MQMKTGLELVAFVAIVAGVTACSDNSQKSEQAGSATGSVLTPTSAPAPDMSTFKVLVSKSPLFDSADGWGAGYAMAVGHGAGVVVGPGAENPNVFAQQFPAAQGEQFKLVARASSVDAPKATGRFQINWLDANSKFISVSIQAFDVTSEEKTFEHVVTAPIGAVAGTLYVVADGPQDVVRYTEMRVLGK